MVYFWGKVYVMHAAHHSSFGFDTAVEEAEKAIKSARVEASCTPNGVIFLIVHFHVLKHDFTRNGVLLSCFSRHWHCKVDGTKFGVYLI